MVESRRADALHQAAFPQADGTPVIVVFNADGLLAAKHKAGIGVALGVLLDTFLVCIALVPGLTLAVGPKAG